MSGGLVRVMDHDCVWVGTSVGEGNHRAFVLMLVAGEAALLLCAHTLLLHVGSRSRALRLLRLALGAPAPAAAAAVHARLLLLVAALCALLLLGLTPLLFGQLSLVATNLTTVEYLRAIRSQAAEDLAESRSRAPGFSCNMPIACRIFKYAPHNRGVLRNVIAFVRAQRSVGVGVGAVAPAPPPAAEDTVSEAAALKQSDSEA